MIAETLINILAIVVVAFTLYMAFIIMPFALYTDAKCLRNGYPKSEVTIGLVGYCMNMTGSVTVTVDKSSEQKK